MHRQAAATGDSTVGPEDYLDRVGELAPVIERNIPWMERERRLAPEVLDGLHGAGLYRLLLPSAYNGAQIDPDSFSRIIEAVAQADASTAWCLCQANGCAMTAAYLPPQVAEEIWGSDPRAALAWGPGAKSRAQADGDGYVLNGNWAFASGGRHATWLGGHALIVEPDGELRRDAAGQPVDRTFLFPAGEAVMTDNWDVMGLRATGSDSFAVSDLRVRHDHSVSRDDPAERSCDAPLYRFPAMSLYAAGFSGTAIGIAKSVLRSFLELATDKRPRLARDLLRDDGMVQAEVALAEARLRAARAYLSNELRDVWHDVLGSSSLSVDGRVRIRLAATYAIHEAKSVVDTLYDAAGATAIFAAQPFERRFRDIHAVAQQLQGRKSHFRTVGAYRMGHDADMSVL